jgi:hypothetical protein
MVVFTLPTFASKDSLAKSTAYSGLSAIFSRSTLEHRGDVAMANEYSSQKVRFLEKGGLFPERVVKTACLSLNMAIKRSC